LENSWKIFIQQNTMKALHSNGYKQTVAFFYAKIGGNI